MSENRRLGDVLVEKGRSVRLKE